MTHDDGKGQEAAARLTLSQAELSTFVAKKARVPLVDELLAVAQDRAAMRKLLKAESAERQLGACHWHVLAALGTDAVAALEVINERMRVIDWRYRDWDCQKALEAIDGFERDCAWARLYGHVRGYAAHPARALRALSLVAGAKTEPQHEEAAEAIAEILTAHPDVTMDDPVVREVAARYGIGRTEATGEEIPTSVRPSGKRKLPEFWNAGLVPRPQLAGSDKVLPLAALDELVAKLDKNEGLDLRALLATCEPGSLRDFAWGVFRRWLRTGAPAKQKWALTMLGPLGDDDTVARLAPLIGEWPGQSAHARAVLGLSVLDDIGTDAALRAIYRLSQRAKFGGLKDAAQRAIRGIAARRSLTEEELADRLVPDLDLDADGSRTLDFGPRTFRVGFDEGLKPFVFESNGKHVADLPKPKQSDDAARAKEAHDTWKALKKEVRAIASLQIERLEKAMCSRRRWHRGTFQMYFVEHPLLQHLAKRLVWSVWKDGALTATFRVTEDRALADDRDATVDVGEQESIGLVHPLDLGEAHVTRWTEVLGDYKILQPFEQLARKVHTPTVEERSHHELRRFDGREVSGGAILGLISRGWSRGPVEDNGIVWEMHHAAGVLPLGGGLIIGGGVEQPTQRLGAIKLAATFDALAFSEMVRSLEGLHA